MEVAIYNIKGEDTGRKAQLADEVFAIDANEHAVYLDVKQYLANQRQGTHKRFPVLPASFTSRRVAAAAVSVTSIHPYSWVVAVCSVPVPVTIVSS